MSSTEVRWIGRWEAARDAEAFERFLEDLSARASGHIRITRRAQTCDNIVISPDLVGILGDADLVASMVDGTVVAKGAHAGGIAVEHLRIRGYEIGLSTWSELATFSFQSLDEPRWGDAHGLLIDLSVGSHDRVCRMPSIMLRYILESWINDLLAATKMLFLPNLSYFNRGRFSGYEDFVRLASAALGHQLPINSAMVPAAVRWAVEHLAEAALAGSGPLVELDAVLARVDAFPDELRAAGVSEDDIAFLLSAGVTPELVDSMVTTGRWSDVREVAEHLRGECAAHDAAKSGLDLDAITNIATWRRDDTAN